MGHTQAPHAKDSFQIPVSGGIPPGVRFSFLACGLLVLMVLGSVIISSGTNHVWPAGASLKIPL